MKILRGVLAVTASIVVVGAIAFACLVMFFDPNKFKPLIVSEVMKASGYQLTIEGQMTWTLYPRLGVNVPRMLLRAPKQTALFADLQGVNIGMGLMQLLKQDQPLRGDVRVASLRLKNIMAEKAHVDLQWHDDVLTMDFNLRDGVVEGLDLNYLVKTANDFINGHPVSISLPPHTVQTHFQHLTGTAVVKNGVVTNNNLTIYSNDFTTKGRGEIQLLRQRIHYQLQVAPAKQDNIHWDVPVLITGDLRDPSIRVDTRSLQALVLKDKVNEVREKIQKSANKLLEKLIGD